MLTIHREKEPDKLIRMGHAPVALEPPTPIERSEARAQLGYETGSVIPEPPPEPVKNKQGRPKKMADKNKNLDEVGTKTIRKDDAGDQGAIGSHGQNAPAQEKVPDGDKEGQKNA